MSFQIDRGLFKFDFTDYHAILGIPVDADEKEVRKRYLRITRNLHPDSCKADSEQGKAFANQLLSKLVNPAYEQLSRGHREYQIRLGHLGKRLAAEGGKFAPKSDLAKQLTQAGVGVDPTYRNALKTLTSNQYDELDRVLDKIGEISELNMVYLMLKARQGEAVKSPKSPVTAGKPGARPPVGVGGGRQMAGTGATSGSSGNKLSDSQTGSRVDDYLRRAEGYMAKNNFAGAVLELREALKLDASNHRSHSLLGIAYLKQNQATMAKVHVNKALQLNPRDERALKAKKYLERLAQQKGGGKSATPSKPASSQDSSSKSGLFGRIFGKS
jgi:curved DNA-binding protein CbpA